MKGAGRLTRETVLSWPRKRLHPDVFAGEPERAKP